jgi:TetR/AcrR family transcriptional regulator, cholesterol catabolism regulator
MRRSEIIQAAAQIFRQKGYNAASMQDIADAVNLQKASLYHHVTSKQDILFSILEQTLDLLISELRSVIDSDLAADEKLRVAMQVYIGRLTDDADLSAVLLLEHRSLEHRLRDRHNARRDRYEELWRSILREGIESGVFRSFDIEVSTFAILGVQNWLITWYRSEGRLTAIELADHFSDLLLHGLLSSDKEK